MSGQRCGKFSQFDLESVFYLNQCIFLTWLTAKLTGSNGAHRTVRCSALLGRFIDEPNPSILCFIFFDTSTFLQRVNAPHNSFFELQSGISTS
jgi:hypothetical protein